MIILCSDFLSLPLFTVDGYYLIEIEPFQIMYTTVSDKFTAYADLDYVDLLRATRQHLADQLRKVDVGFARLFLHYAVEGSENMNFQNGMKVTYRGAIYFQQQQDKMMEEKIKTDTLLSFVGDNKTRYAFAVQEIGWKSLHHTNLMSQSGKILDYEDGNMIERGGSAAITNKNNGGMSTTTYFIAVLAPTYFLLLMGISYTIFYALHRDKLNKSRGRKRKKEEKAPLGISEIVVEIRRRSSEIDATDQEIGDDTSDGTSTIGFDSVFVDPKPQPESSPP